MTTEEATLLERIATALERIQNTLLALEFKGIRVETRKGEDSTHGGSPR